MNQYIHNHIISEICLGAVPKIIIKYLIIKLIFLVSGYDSFE